MKIAKILAALGTVAMTAALLNGFITGDFFEDGSVILNNPWGIVSLVDLYVGFTLFAIWIYYRETTWHAKILWIVSLMILGFFIGAIYVFVKLYTSKDISEALLGSHGINKVKTNENH